MGKKGVLLGDGKPYVFLSEDPRKSMESSLKNVLVSVSWMS